jgi:hypothetical protein
MVRPGALRRTISPLLLRLLAVAIVALGIWPGDVAAPAWSAICGQETTTIAPVSPETAVAVRGDAMSAVTLRATKRDLLPDSLGAALPDPAPRTALAGSVGRGPMAPRAPPQAPDPILRPAAHGPPAFRLTA